MAQLCGPYLGECISAFLNIAANLPDCAEKIIYASKFTGRSGL